MRNSPFILLIVSLLLLSCKKENMGDCFKSTGKTTQEERLLPVFRNLRIEGGMNVYFTQSNQQKVSVRAGKNVIDLIKTEVNGNTLHIQNDNRCNWVRSFKRQVDIYIQTPDIKDVWYSGWGKLQMLNQFQVDTFQINIWDASGDVNLNLQSDYVELKSNTGTGTIVCQGNTREIILFNGGFGFVDAKEIDSEFALAVIENTADIKVSVRDHLKADIAGQGNIEYYGNPTIELIDRGSGLLIKR